MPVKIEGKVVNDIAYTGKWENNSSAEKGAALTVKFTGKQIGFYGQARPDGGYAKVTLRNSKGKVVLNSTVDMYCKYPVSTLKFLTPALPPDNYTLTVTVTGERGNWSDKQRSDYGSTGYFVAVEEIVVF